VLIFIVVAMPGAWCSPLACRGSAVRSASSIRRTDRRTTSKARRTTCFFIVYSLRVSPSSSLTTPQGLALEDLFFQFTAGVCRLFYVMTRDFAVCFRRTDTSSSSSDGSGSSSGGGGGSGGGRSPQRLQPTGSERRAAPASSCIAHFSCTSKRQRTHLAEHGIPFDILTVVRQSRAVRAGGLSRSSSGVGVGGDGGGGWGASGDAAAEAPVWIRYDSEDQVGIASRGKGVHMGMGVCTCSCACAFGGFTSAGSVRHPMTKCDRAASACLGVVPLNV
jgi:hypothetical protein